MVNRFTYIFALLFGGIVLNPQVLADPLSSWNDTAPKKALIAFVTRVTQELSPDFVPAPERIAVFDNDGTLWPENPVPTQLAFAFDEVKRLAPFHPDWQADQYMQAVLTGDTATLLADHHAGLMRVLGLTHAGMSTDEFKLRVEVWLATAKHPRFGKPYTEVIYQPMLEVLDYLRANGFKTFIVSGGGADFMRVWSERVYGIPPEQVIGSTALPKFELRAGNPVLIKTTDHLFVDDKAGKPVGIHQFIGRRPIASFGNSDGDLAMLQYTTIGNPRPSFGLIVHHTDSAREYAYDAEPQSSGKLVDALSEAPQRGWVVASMKDDWKQIWPVKKTATVEEEPFTLPGTEWQVKEIAGKQAEAKGKALIRFEEDGRVTGHTGCNPFTGTATLADDKLKFGPLATTRRACKPELLQQAVKFLEVSEQVRRFVVDKNGQVQLLNSSGKSMLRLSPILEEKPA
ncbi:MAG: META domain-containing protein, partial [Candidatus Competibacteraceae bacterium]|nr:META domain-containing protein [Candidatus Competibacteraceae bacterium]